MIWYVVGRRIVGCGVIEEWWEVTNNITKLKYATREEAVLMCSLLNAK